MAHQEALRETSRLHELGLRTLVAAIAVPLVGLIVTLGPRPSAVLFGVAAAIGCSEYYRLTLGAVSGSAWVGIAAAAIMPLVPVFVADGDVAGALFGIVAASSMLIWTIHLVAGPRATAPERQGTSWPDSCFRRWVSSRCRRSVPRATGSRGPPSCLSRPGPMTPPLTWLEGRWAGGRREWLLAMITSNGP